VTHILCPATVYGFPFLSCTVPPAAYKINLLTTISIIHFIYCNQ
jgi:hypothetical protein